MEKKNVQNERKRAADTTARKSWQEKKKTTNLNFERDGQTLWTLVKTLNGDYDYRLSPMVIESVGDTLTRKAAANTLIAQYKVDGEINYPQKESKK